ncbi:FadR/GntR family transcriptional regulator [Sphingopyxis terrae]|uniref:FadR/GntR family transcriptional regulator n=1 Tax=Sphingopyxis terrae TaxID=33052 RepID=UPI0020D2071B|nr:FCD domain-containing protein [Sphingopyxis terrae]
MTEVLDSIADKCLYFFMSPAPQRSPDENAPAANKAKRALQVAQAIVSDIQLNAREAGDRLPQEEDMLARYEVARATLREALRFLELQGVIQLQLGRGGGPVVSRPQTRDFASSLSLILQFMDTDLRALLELREAIAPDMAAKAAARATNADLAALGDCYAQLERDRETAAFEETNRRFHDLLGWASGNPTFGLLTSALHLLTRDLAVELGYSAQERANQLRCLARVLNAVRLRDADGARRHMARLVTGSSAYLAARSPELVSQKVRWGDPG